jgi:uncharacterized coiled-coil protein SlyX
MAFDGAASRIDFGGWSHAAERNAMTDQERQASYARRDEMRAEDHATLKAIRSWLFWASTTGALVLFGAVWFAAEQHQRLSVLEARADQERVRVEGLAARVSTSEAVAAGVGARIDNQSRTLERIETRLERLVERLESTGGRQ